SSSLAFKVSPRTASSSLSSTFAASTSSLISSVIDVTDSCFVSTSFNLSVYISMRMISFGTIAPIQPSCSVRFVLLEPFVTISAPHRRRAEPSLIYPRRYPYSFVTRLLRIAFAFEPLDQLLRLLLYHQ